MLFIVKIWRYLFCRVYEGGKEGGIRFHSRELCNHARHSGPTYSAWNMMPQALLGVFPHTQRTTWMNITWVIKRVIKKGFQTIPTNMIKKPITNVWKKFLMNFSVSVSIRFMDLSSNLAYDGLNGIKSAKMCQQLVFRHTKKMSCGKVLYLFFNFSHVGCFWNSCTIERQRPEIIRKIFRSRCLDWVLHTI